MKTATAYVLLAISLVVAVLNAIVGRFYYFLFVIPFFFAVISHHDKSTLLQIIGLFSVGCYLLADEYYLGMMVMFTVGTMVYINYGPSKSKLFIIASSIPIGIFSYIYSPDSRSIAIHVFADLFVYVLACFFAFLVIVDYKNKMSQAQKTVDQKYIEVIDELQRVAHESIDILKHMQDEARSDRSRKNC